MCRIGFDKKIHPYQLQLRLCAFPDLEGIQNRSGVTLDLREGTIKNYNTTENIFRTTIREYIASDDELKELYSFLTMDAIKEFEAMTESEIYQYETGYYDWASLRYLMISAEGRISDGVRHHIYSNDPIEMAMKWMRRTVPFKLDI